MVVPMLSLTGSSLALPGGVVYAGGGISTAANERRRVVLVMLEVV